VEEQAKPSRAGAHSSFEVSARAKSACAELREAAAALKHPAPPEPLCEELVDAVIRAATQSAESMQALRRAVCRFTLTLRDDGASPEGILIALKSVINSRVFPLIVSPTRDVSADRLREQISTWCIEEMFREKQS